jgi:ABC-2 type transport system ATP-binding protein
MHAPRIPGRRRADRRHGPARRASAQAIFRELAAGGATVFMSTHSLEVAEELCDRIGIIQRGR